MIETTSEVVACESPRRALLAWGAFAALLLLQWALFRILLCTVVRSGFFSSLRWSLAVGAVALLLVLFRFLTSVYLAGILGAWWLFTAARWVLSRDPEQRTRLRRQLLGGVLAGAVL